MNRPVGRLIVDRVGVEPGLRVLDVGTGSGGNVAIPAAQLGAEVVGLDITPELFVHARRRAAKAGVEVEWIEGDAQELPFADASFDRVTSTFGAMFAPFESVDDAVEQYAGNFGPFVSARAALQPSGRWEQFIAAFRDLVNRFNSAADGTARIRSDYFVVLIER